jgi:tRNA (mo5U34)-methyltransferase
MTSTDISSRIRAFPYWHYRIDLAGNITPTSEAEANRQIQRKVHFFDPLVEWLGGSLAGKRVLDLGCNAGYWSLCALEAGCDFVIGIDTQAVNLAQAQLVFDVKGIARERYLFKRASIFNINLRQFGEFDIVLCLGLLYHVNQPITLLEKTAQVSGDILLIDTEISRLPGRSFEMKYEPGDVHPTLLSSEHNLVLWPTRQAVVEITNLLGYRSVILKPKFSNYLGAQDYKSGHRRVFVCAKRTDLSDLPAEIETPNPVVEIAHLHREYMRRVFGHLRRWKRIRIDKPINRA